MPLLSIFKRIVLPLTTLFIFLLGAGYFSTLLALKMTLVNASPLMIGSLTGVFYAGLLMGSFRADVLIHRVGHLRSYALFAGCLALFAFFQGFYYQFATWMCIRFFAGLAMGGLFVVIESWFLGVSTQQTRGQIMSLYMISFYGAQSLGQWFLKAGNPMDAWLFVLSGILCALSIVPIFFSKGVPPSFNEPVALEFKKIIEKARPALAGALTAGLIMGGIYGLLPTYLTHVTGSTQGVAEPMFFMILGGMLFQYPLGRLSDRVPRRFVMMGLSVSAMAICMQMLFMSESSWLFLVLMFLFGGFTYAFYPISVSLAGDVLEAREIVPATQSLLLVYSLGAMIGPFIAAGFLRLFSDMGLMVFFAVSSGCVLPFLMLNRYQRVRAIR